MCVIIYNVGSINNNIEVSVRDKTSELLLDRDYVVSISLVKVWGFCGF